MKGAGAGSEQVPVEYELTRDGLATLSRKV